MADHRVFERFSIPHIHAHGLLRLQVVDEQVHHRVRVAGFDVWLEVERAVNARLVERERKVAHPTFIELVERNLLAVARPPHGRVLVQFLTIHPRSRAELHPCLFISLGGDGVGAMAIGGTQPKIPVAIKSPPLAIRRDAERILASPLDSFAGAPSAAAGTTGRVNRRSAGVGWRLRQQGSFATAEVIAVARAVAAVLQSSALIPPRH